MTARLLIVGGPGGAGSSTWAARIADSLADGGARVGVAALDPHFGADQWITDSGCTPIRTDRQLPSEIAAAGEAWRLDPVAMDQAFDGIAHRGLPLLWRIPRVLEQFDHVVLDLGSALSRALLAVHQLRWYLGELGPMHSGWLKATRPVTALAMGPSAMGKLGTRQLAAIDQHLATLAEVITTDQSVVLLAHGAGPRASEKVRRHAGVVSLAQARTSAVLVAANDPDGPLRTHLDRADVPVLTELTRNWVDRLADPPRAVTVEGDARSDDEIVWRMPLPFNEFDEVDVEQAGERLMIGVHGERRTFVLPSALRRYSASSARLRAGILDVHFNPDPPTQPRRTTK